MEHGSSVASTFIYVRTLYTDGATDAYSRASPSLQISFIIFFCLLFLSRSPDVEFCGYR